MTLWILWSIAASVLIAAATAALDRAASFIGAPRRFVWIAATVAICVVPAVLGLRRAPARSGSPVLPSAGSATTPMGVSSRPSSSAGIATVQAPNNHLASWSASAAPADEWVVRAWIAASGVLLFLLAATTIRLRIRRSRWTTADTEVGQVDVAANVGPAVVGFLHPRIVVPTWALSMESRARELLLLHELEHVRAGDTRVLLAAELALVVFPWNAALWWMVHRLRLSIEIDCDARVIRTLDGAHEYGSMLLDIGERYGAALPFAASLLEPRSSLEARIDALTAVRRQRPVAASLPLLTMAGIALVTVAWTPRPYALLRARILVAPPVDHTVEAIVSPDSARRPRSVAAAVPSRERSTVVGTTANRDSASAASDPEALPRSPELVALESSLAHSEDSVLALVGYLERKQLGRGVFMDGDQIDRNLSSFSDVLRAAPAARNQLSGCVNAFIDGMRWESLAPGDLDEFVKPLTLLAVESYRRSEAPPQFTPRGEPPCATVVVWTRAWVRR